jgi:hypothetical protein
MSKFKQYYYSIKESYAGMFKTPSNALNYYNKDYVEYFKNPSENDIEELYKNSFDFGIRMGIDKEGTIYAWNDGILHSDAEKLIDKNFIIKIEYTKDRNKLVLSTADMTDSTDELLKKLNKSTLVRLKLTFPLIKTITMNRKPFTVLYDYDKKQTLTSLKHTGVEEWITKLSLLEIKDYSKKHPNLTKETKKMLEKERILRSLERSLYK